MMTLTIGFDDGERGLGRSDGPGVKGVLGEHEPSSPATMMA